MLDLNYVRENIDKVHEALEKRNASEEMVNLLKRFVEADKDRRGAIGESDRLNQQRNEFSRQVGTLMKEGLKDEATSLRLQVNELKERISTADALRDSSEARMREILVSLPNLPNETVPVGKDESDNVEVRRWGTAPEFNFTPKDHVDLGLALGILDLERATRLASARFAILNGAGARLERAANQIADLRAFNQYVIDSMLSGLVTADMNGRILTFNRAAASITGLPAGQAIGRDITELLQLPAHFRGRLQTLGTTRSQRADHQYRSPDGRLLEIGLTVITLSLPDGRSGYLFTFQDVTDVRRLERGARIQQRLAAVGEMAAGIAHEIRNPLASMSGSIQVLREELPLTEEQAQLMDIVLRESERLNDTIKSFLAYARPQRVTLTVIKQARPAH